MHVLTGTETNKSNLPVSSLGLYHQRPRTQLPSPTRFADVSHHKHRWKLKERDGQPHPQSERDLLGLE